MALAKPPTTETYVVPSPKDDDKQTPSYDIKNETSLNTTNLELSPKDAPPPHPFAYHLPLRPSVTLLLSRHYGFKEEVSDGWLGVHVAPWVRPTSRIQIGIDANKTKGLLQVAYHYLPTRDYSRFYGGAGASILVDPKDELRPFLKTKNYFAFGVIGYELQVADLHSLRAEFSYHLGFEDSLIKASVGYTFLL